VSVPRQGHNQPDHNQAVGFMVADVLHLVTVLAIISFPAIFRNGAVANLASATT
jgi:hypothetical protein